MTTVTINGHELDVPAGYTVLQACQEAGVEIPRFCYHEKLEIAGNCRMCLVKIEKSPKLVASCAQPVAEGMVITTNSEEVKKAREGVMEFLLINHPLDCPICDQAGECDLQDQAMRYGRGTSRFEEAKRSVEDKEMGPLIKTNMTRCIHCTRCVRFLEDIAGTSELGAIGRGEDMEISTYVGHGVRSELSGNIVDLCPVGALTSRPYAFRARPWELTKTPSIDVLDAVGSNIRIDSKGNEVLRILPRSNDEINEEWISDKTRHACDGLKYQRLDSPMLKQNGKWIDVGWDDACKRILKILTSCAPSNVGMIAGDMVSAEDLYMSKMFMKTVGSGNYDARQDGCKATFQNRADYIFNTTIERIEEADFCLIIGSNPRLEAPIVNARIRKAVQRGGAKIALIGDQVQLTYKYQHFGDNPWLLKQIADGQHPFCSELHKFKKPMLIIGAEALTRSDADAIMYHAKKLAFKYNFVQEGWSGFNVMQKAASRVAALDLGLVPEAGCLNAEDMIRAGLDVLFLLAADEFDARGINAKEVVYIGHHGDLGAACSTIVLPSPAYTEQDGIYVNLEGRVQFAHQAVQPLCEARSAWMVFAQMMGFLDRAAPNTLDEVRASMIAQYPVFGTDGLMCKPALSPEGVRSSDFALEKLKNSTVSFYLTDPISRSSKTMAECARFAQNVA